MNEEIASLLERFHLADVMNERTAILPYGKQRLLEIAVAIACRPRVLLLDEPAAGVPEDERHEILASIAALPADVTVLLIEHDMDIVFSFAQTAFRCWSTARCSSKACRRTSRATRASRRSIWARKPMSENMSDQRARLTLEKLSAGYGEAQVLREVSLSMPAGKSLALLGRNGMGKTTLLNTIVGVTRYRGGKIILDGRDITGLRPDQRAHAGIGWVPQERNIFKSLTVEENLTAIARPGAWTVEKVYAMFPRLKERRQNLGSQLSGGEQQMLAIGRALILNPRIMLLDEPLEGLAPIIVEELLVALQRIIREEGISAILVEQNAKKILGIVDRAVIIERGGIVHESDSLSLRNDQATLETYLGVAKLEAAHR